MRLVCVSWALLAMLPFSSVLLRAQDAAAVGDQDVPPNQTDVLAGQAQQISQSSQAPLVLTGLGSAPQGALSAERDQLVPEFRVLETVESNPNQLPDASEVRSITRILGTVGVERVRNFTDLKLAYVGGAELFNDQNGEADRNRQLQEVYFDGKLKWKRTELHLVNAFSYLPEAAFGAGSFGGLGVFQSMLGGFLSGLASSGLARLSPAQFASIGNSPRVVNTSVVELSHRVTPRGMLTAAAAYGLLHFYEAPTLPNENQGIVELGYNYAVGPRDTAAVLGGYGTFHISQVGQAFTTTYTELFWGHQFSHRLTLAGGAGPQVLDIKESGGGRELTWTAVARLGYEGPRTATSLRYLHYINGGSGLLLGAHSDVVVFEVSRQLNRTWNAALHAGYARSTQIEGVSAPPASTISSSGTVDHAYAGARFSRPLSQHTQLYVLYYYAQTDLGQNPFCSSTGECGKVVRQNVGGVGFTWAPRPIRLP